MTSHATKVSRLRTHRLFAEASDDLLASAKVRFATFAPGEVLAHHGDRSAPLVLIVSGRAQSSRYSEDGRELGVAFLGPGDSSGEAAILLDVPAMFSVTAVNTVLAGLVTRTEARRLFTDTAIADALLRLLAGKLELVVDNHAALTLPSAHARVYAVILNAFRSSTDEAEPPELPSQAAIALAANVSRETVSRALKTLVSRGAIAKAGRRYLLTDRQMLQRLAAES